MAKDKASSNLVALGTVVKKYDSGICETDKGNKVNGKFDIGSVLLMDSKTKKVSAKTKNTTSSNKNADKDQSENELNILDEIQDIEE